MNQIAILSGKGGTGKTSISAAFATINSNTVVADCDVDAANLYLILQPQNYKTEHFITGFKAIIDYNKCTNCGLCAKYCRFGAINTINGRTQISETSCDGCKLCSNVCNFNAITMMPSQKSCWYIGNYRNGTMIHARLWPGEENSGKLVNIVREQATKVAALEKNNTIIIDGPPGIGCPVISTITGIDKAIIVTEPSSSAFNDMNRLFELIKNFKTKPYVIINKYDLNTDISKQILNWCVTNNVEVLGQIPFDPQIVESMLNCKSIIEWAPESETSKTLINIWNKLLKNDTL